MKLDDETKNAIYWITIALICGVLAIVISHLIGGGPL